MHLQKPPGPANSTNSTKTNSEQTFMEYKPNR